MTLRRDLRQGPALESDVPVMMLEHGAKCGWLTASKQDDQLVGPVAVRCEAGHRELGVPELVDVTEQVLSWG